MKKALIVFLSTLFITTMGLTLLQGATAQTHTETFDTFPETGSTYQNGSFTGTSNISWDYEAARGDQDLGSGHALTFGDSGRNPSLIATIQGGITEFSVDYTNAFSQPSGLELYINGALYDKASNVKNEVATFNVTNLDIDGEFTLELRPTKGQTTIDNLSWTEYSAPVATYDITLSSNIPSATVSADPGTTVEENTLTTLTAEETSGDYTFSHWETASGDTLSTDNPYSFTMTSNVEAIAIFESTAISNFENVEPFDQFPETSSTYQNGSFTGINGILWSYASARGDKNIASGHALTFGDTSRTPSLSATIDGGISDFSVKYLNAFSSPAGLELYINGTLVDTSLETDGVIETFSVEGINIDGTFTMEIVPTNGQTIIDNLSWNTYEVSAPTLYDVSVDSNITTAQSTVSPSSSVEAGTSVTVETTDTSGENDFSHYEDSLGNIVSSSNPYTFTVEDTTSLTAIYEPKPVVDNTVETFDQFPETSSTYQNGNFTGVNGILWSYISARGDKDIASGHALTFGDTSRTPSLFATIDGGIKSFSVDYTNAFSSDAGLSLYINGTLQATSSEVNGVVSTFTVDGIDVNGSYTLELVPTNGQTIIDNLTLTPFEGTTTPETVDMTATSNIETAEVAITPSSSVEVGTEVTFTASETTGDYVFSHFENASGTTVSSSNPYIVTAETSLSLVAIYEAVPTGETLSESFNNFPETGSTYMDGSFTGDNGFVWNYASARGDKDLGTGHALTLGDTSRTPSLSATIEGGMSGLSVDYLNAFSSPAGVAIYVNGTLIGQSSETNGVIETYTLSNLNITGTFLLEIVPTDGQTIMDNLVIETSGSTGGDYTIDLSSNIPSAEFSISPAYTVAPGTDVTISVTDTTNTYTFARWKDASGNTLSLNETFTTTVNSNLTLEAVYDTAPSGDYPDTSTELDIQFDASFIEHYSYGDTWQATDGCSAVNLETNEEVPCSVDGLVDTSSLGEYQVTYYAQDSVGDYASHTLTVPVLSDATLLDFDYSTVQNGYYSNLEGLYGDDLALALSNAISNINLQTYGDSRYILDESDQDPLNPDNLILIYRRESVSGVWDSGITWNREHIWPQSLLDVDTNNSSRHEGSDLHNLAPADPGENSSRSNKYYGEMTTSTTYAPHDDVKGDVARALFYMDVMYDHLTLVDGAPSVHEMGDLSLLIDWAEMDTVNQFEQNRNDVIYSYQNNRNPFIDLPHLMELIYFDHPSLVN